MWRTNRRELTLIKIRAVPAGRQEYSRIRFAGISVKGFTFIETLVVVSIFAILATAVFSVFGAGLKIYGKVKIHTGSQADILLSMEKFQKDLRNIFCFSGIDFTGEAASLSFAGLIRFADGKGNQKLSVGRITYYFDEETGALIRKEESYPEAASQEEGGAQRALASIEGLKFRYYHFESETREYIWRDSWEAASGLPRGVKIEITFSGGDKEVVLDKTVFIPISG